MVPDGDQAPGVDSDGYRVGLKRRAAAPAAGISRSQYEVYSFIFYKIQSFGGSC